MQLMPSASFCHPIRMFFDACDGIFTNYNWTEQSLEWMKSYSAAQGRLADIYVGVDVFARGKVVGGKFETNKVSEVLVRESFLYMNTIIQNSGICKVFKLF